MSNPRVQTPSPSITSNCQAAGSRSHSTATEQNQAEQTTLLRRLPQNSPAEEPGSPRSSAAYASASLTRR